MSRFRSFILGLVCALLAPGAASAQNLTVADVQQVIAQAVGEAQARGNLATIAVSDRVGNILAVFQMTGAAATFNITSNRIPQGAVTVTGWCQLRVASSFLL